jgi:hypothetical protein
VCSHPACRAGGVKFCMCTHYKFPVAKRNFRIRHHHCQDERIPNTTANGERGRFLVPQNETGLPLSHQAAASKISVCSSQNDVERSMMPSHWGHLASTQPSRQEELVNKSALQFSLLQAPNALDPARHDGAAELTAEHASSRTAFKRIQGFYLQGLGSETTLLSPGMSKSEQTLANSNPIGMANLMDHCGKASPTADSTAGLRTKAEQSLAGEGTDVIPCRARGMPPDHNADVSM